MSRIHSFRCIGTLTLLVVLTGACSEETTGPDDSEALPRGATVVELDPEEFTTEVDNRYFPLVPGTRWTYLETEEGEVQTVVVTVTSDTRRIANGVTARVVRDTVTAGGQLIEDTFDWFAQDADGNVWYLGEDTAEFEDGELTSTEGSFEAGADGAEAGIIMPGEPAPGQAYRQEFLRGEAEDNGEVLALGRLAEVPAGAYDDVLLTSDTTALEPDVEELKLYAPGVGLVLTLAISGGSGREELLEVTQVSDEVADRAGSTPLGETYD